jgi:hypothetical protein
MIECPIIQIFDKPKMGFIQHSDGYFFYVFRKPKGKGRNKEQWVTVYPLNELALKKCAEDIEGIISKR